MVFIVVIVIIIQWHFERGGLSAGKILSVHSPPIITISASTLPFLSFVCLLSLGILSIPFPLQR
jgi:hypothetical protein